MANFIFIDSSVQDLALLINSLQPNMQVHVLDAAQDGVKQIAAVLRSKEQAKSNVYIVAHGCPGTLYLGNAELSISTLEYYTE